MSKLSARKRPSIYIAAPLFTPAERAFNLELERILSSAFDTFLPQRDGFLIPGKEMTQKEFCSAVRTVFRADIGAIRASAYVLAVLDGRSVDEGVAFELGYASALGKRCLGLKTDARTLLPWGDNPMIAGALETCFRSLQELQVWIENHSEGLSE